MGTRLAALTAVWNVREYRAFLLIMVLNSLALSASAPLISLYLVSQLHVSVATVGIYFAAQALPSLGLGIFIGRRSDRWHSRLPVLRAAALWTTIGWIAFAFSPFIWLTLLVAVLFLSASGAIMGLSFAALHDVMTARDEKRAGLINTTVRTGWSFGFVFGPLVGTQLAAHAGFRLAFLVTAALYLLCAVPVRNMRIEVQSAPHNTTGRSRSSTTILLVLFTALCACVLCGSAIKNTYLPIDVTRHLGGTLGQYGTVVSVSPVVEMLAMPLAGLLTLRLPLGRLITTGLILATLEYLLLALTSALWQLYVIQAMDAWVVAVIMGLGLTYAQQLSPGQAGFATSIVGSSFGIATIVGNLLGSVAIPFTGIPGVFFVPMVLCALAFVLFQGIEHANRSSIPEAQPAPANSG